MAISIGAPSGMAASRYGSPEKHEAISGKDRGNARKEIIKSMTEMARSQVWRKAFQPDPIPLLLGSQNQAIVYFTQRDLMDETSGITEIPWEHREALKILRRQQADGSWKYPGAKSDARTREDNNQLETFRNLGELIEKYAFNKQHAAVKNGAEYLFSCQTEDR